MFFENNLRHPRVIMMQGPESPGDTPGRAHRIRGLPLRAQCFTEALGYSHEDLEWI